jgi:GTPase SAR1 family protein
MNDNNDSNEIGDTTTLFVGDSGSGKSTLIQSFLKPSNTKVSPYIIVFIDNTNDTNFMKAPKSTFALDYNFARRKASGIYIL